MSAITCSECGRTNAADARICIWCGVPRIDDVTTNSFEPMKTEVDYVEGFDRLDGPATVALTIAPDGLEVRELMPGTRTIRIPPESIVSASVTGPLRRVGQPSGSTGWLRRKAASGQLPSQRASLSIKYREEGEIKVVVFERTDAAGMDVIRRFARTIAMLVRKSSEGDAR